MQGVRKLQKFCHFLCQISPGGASCRSELLEHLPHYRTDAIFYHYRNLHLTVLPPEASPLFQYEIRVIRERVFFLQGEFFDRVRMEEMERLLRQDQIAIEDFGAWLRDLNGLFSGLLYDAGTGATISFTDQFGFEFVFYSRLDGNLFISSSNWPLVKAQPVLDLNPGAVADTILLSYPTDDSTLVRNIRKVLPGHLLRHDPDGGDALHFYERFPARKIQSARQGRKNLIDAEHAHFEYIRTRFDPSRLTITLTGGHDSRAYLNMLLKEGVHPHCLTYIHPQDRWDGLMAEKIAALTGCPWHPFPDAPLREELAADAYFMHEQGLSGPWLLLVSEGAEQYGDAMYFGYTGDPLGGSCHLTKTMSYYRKHHNQLIHDAFWAEYSFLQPIEDLLLIYPHQDKTQVMTRYSQHYLKLSNLHPQDQYIMHRTRVRNFGRVARWSNMNKLGAHRLYVFHDKRLVREYENLASPLVKNDRVHTRLGYHAVPRLKWYPVTHYNFPLLIEPFFQRYRELISREYYMRRNHQVLNRSIHEYKAGKRRIKLDNRVVLESFSRYQLFDSEQIARVMLINPGRATLLLRHLESVIKLLQFYNDELPERIVSNLFTSFQHVSYIELSSDYSLTASSTGEKG